MRQFSDEFPRLFRVAYSVSYRVLGSRTEAEDVAQEALIRAYARWRRVEPHADAWISRVSTNLAIDRFRRLRARPSPASEQEPSQFADERMDLVRALRALPKRQREVVAMRYLADLSEADVAAALGIAAGTVKAHAARGLAALRPAMNERH